MAIFADLPNEILLRVIVETIPDGIEAFAQCSKQLYRLAEKCLKQHNLNKVEYSDIVISAEEPYDFSPAAFLRDILRNPLLAQYPRIVDFGKGSFYIDSPGVDDLEESLTEVLTQCPYIPKERHPTVWAWEILSGREDAFIAIFLLLLPNIEEITIEPTYLRKYCLPMMYRVMESFADPVNKKTDRVLAKLSKVNLVISDRSWMNLSTLFQDRYVAMLIHLPRPMTLSGTANGIRVEFCHPQRGVGHIGLHVLNRMITARQLAGFLDMITAHQPDGVLKNVTGLRAFTYDCNPPDSLLFSPWFGDDIGKILRDRVSSTLEELDVTCWPGISTSQPFHGVTNLVGFSALKKIRINPDTTRCPGRGGVWKRQPLADFLPCSVEELVITGVRTYHDLNRNLHGLADAKAKHFPRLKWIRLEKGRFEVHESTKIACEVAGILLERDFGFRKQ